MLGRRWRTLRPEWLDRRQSHRPLDGRRPLLPGRELLDERGLEPALAPTSPLEERREQQQDEPCGNHDALTGNSGNFPSSARLTIALVSAAKSFASIQRR